MRFFARAALALIAVLPLACSAAEEPKYQLGTHYKQVRVPQTPANPAKIEVMEVFAYSCPHCFHFEEPLNRWLAKKPADVEFVRVPHTLGVSANELRNKAMYASQMLGVVEPFHKTLFGAIHGQGRMVATVDDLRKLMVENTAVKAEDFDGAFSSFAVDSRARIGDNQVREMGISTVPTIVVNGKWYSSPRVGGGFNELLAVTDFLVDKARQERKSR